MITVQKDELVNAIKAVKTSVAKNDIQPSLKSIHLNTQGFNLILTTTDLCSSTKAICEANITENIDICVNADKLDNIISKLDEIITINVKEGFLEIKSGETEFKLIYMSATEFPNVSFEFSNDFVELTKSEFVNGVTKTAISTSKNSTQDVFSSVCITFYPTGYEMASTDGTRLSQVIFSSVAKKQEGKYIIPQKILLDTIKNIGEDVTAYFDINTVIFKTGNYIFKQNLLNGKYPDYQAIIPKNQPLQAKVKRQELLHALEKVAVMCDERTNITVFDFDNNILKLTTACDNGKAKDKINIEFNGINKIALNYKYVLDGIRVMNTEDITFEMAEGLAPCIIKSDFNYLIMPIREKS